LVPNQTAQIPEAPSCLRLHRPLPPPPLPPPPAAAVAVVAVVVDVAAPKRHDEHKDEPVQPGKKRGEQQKPYRNISTVSRCGDWKDILGVQVVITILMVKDPESLTAIGQEPEDKIIHGLIGAIAEEGGSDAGPQKILQPRGKHRSLLRAYARD
jgi:hypothetical protein